ncbi:AMP-binding protein [Coxiella-like endosymbiont of Rhipicephalus sanguineus]|uniref:AMP-binding protein n=1 Tax=Coxiella-like endosymbiont of Rhipicephalus sanguineus TaxID=1955402 RepID=UPI0027E04B6A|nr:AMP-binding protein [Coxiella-like endosymbiont of Rhipicephalus sanguineus]
MKIIIVSITKEKLALNSLKNAKFYRNCLKSNSKNFYFEQLRFNHPIYILYSSGTTGKPKCMVHSARGTLIQHLKELILHTDLHLKIAFSFIPRAAR